MSQKDVGNMTLLEKFKDDLKAAMRAKEAKKLLVLRMLLSAVKNKEISERKDELGDDDVVAVIRTEIKKRKDSEETYRQANRDELADNEKEEIEVLSAYLPQEMNDEDLDKIISEVISASSGADVKMGIIIGQVMERVKGQVNGQRVSSRVGQILN